MTQPLEPPLSAAEDDPDAAEVAELPGYSAGAGKGDAPVGAPSQDHDVPKDPRA